MSNIYIVVVRACDAPLYKLQLTYKIDNERKIYKNLKKLFILQTSNTIPMLNKELVLNNNV